MHAFGLISLFSCMFCFSVVTSNFRAASRGTWWTTFEFGCVAVLVFYPFLILLCSNKQFCCAVISTMHISLTRVSFPLICRSQVHVDQFRAAWHPPIVTPARSHARGGGHGWRSREWSRIGPGSVYIEYFCVTLRIPDISFSFQVEVDQYQARQFFPLIYGNSAAVRSLPDLTLLRKRWFFIPFIFMVQCPVPVLLVTPRGGSSRVPVPWPAALAVCSVPVPVPVPRSVGAAVWALRATGAARAKSRMLQMSARWCGWRWPMADWKCPCRGGCVWLLSSPTLSMAFG